MQLLEQSILELERNGETTEIIQKIFRVAHTLKGSSAAMGFEKMKLLTHEMENVLDKIRNHHLEATKPVINILFQCLDHLRMLKEDFAADRKDIKTDISSTLSKLKKILSGEYNQSKNTKKTKNKVIESMIQEIGQEDKPIQFILDLEQQIQLEQAVISGLNILVCEVKLTEDSVMKSVRAYLIMNHFNQIGTVIKVDPNILETQDDFEISKVSCNKIVNLNVL